MLRAVQRRNASGTTGIFWCDARLEATRGAVNTSQQHDEMRAKTEDFAVNRSRFCRLCCAFSGIPDDITRDATDLGDSAERRCANTPGG